MRRGKNDPRRDRAGTTSRESCNSGQPGPVLRKYVDQSFHRLIDGAGVSLWAVRAGSRESVPLFPREDHDDCVGEEAGVRRCFPEAAKEDEKLSGERGRDPYPSRKGIAVITSRPHPLGVPQLCVREEARGVEDVCQ